MPPRIVLLDEDTISRIAAGEVVERPASIVKELVENSLDAGATHITVDVEEGGKTRLVVEDDGCGMCAEDAVLALQRHATSKIRSAEDLDRIGTLGFRGEALPSVAAVSHLRLTTREPDSEEGFAVYVEGGQVVEASAVGCPPGTRIEVSALFFNTPARLKFLKTATTEMSHIYETVTRMALGHHRVAFRLLHNGREAIFLPACDEVAQTLGRLYGADNAAHLLPLSVDTGPIRISGYLSSPALTRSGRTHQVMFVNGRLVRSRILMQALNEAYHGLLPAGRQPLAFVFVEVDPALYDPNVHPTKMEVRFTREWEVQSLLTKGMREGLRATGLTAESPTFRVPIESPVQAGRSSVPLRPPPSPDPSLFREEVFRKAGFIPPQAPPAERDLTSTPRGPQTEPPTTSVAPEPFQPSSLADAQVLGQLDRTYIVARVADGLLLLDQHSAHERVIYERLARWADDGEHAESQGLVVPLTLTVNPNEAHILEECLPSINNLGFEIERFGSGSFLVRSLPVFVPAGEAEAILTQVAADLAAEKPATGVRKRLDSLLISITCHSAVRSGKDLSLPEMKALLEALSKTQEPMVCPHGRPTFLLISSRRLAHLFRRSGG